MTIQLYWSNFYEQMEKMGLDGQYRKFEEMLVAAFKTALGADDVEIEWMD